MVSNANEEEVWFPFGERNDPKLRRSFNRGVRYAGLPRTPLKSTTTITTSTDVSIIKNPESIHCKSNSENEQPPSIAIAEEKLLLQRPNMEEKEKEGKPCSRQVERSISAQLDNICNNCQTSTTSAFLCRSSAANCNTSNGSSIESMTSPQHHHHQCFVPNNINNNNNNNPPFPSSIYAYNSPSNNICAVPFHHHSQQHQQQQYWPSFHHPQWQQPFNIPPSSPASSFASSNSLTNPSSTPPPLLVYQLVPVDMVSGLPAIIPQAGSPQFVYATSVNGQPVPVSIHQPERGEQRRDSKISLPPIFNFSHPFTTPASPTTSETTSSLSWNSEQEKHDMIASAIMGASVASAATNNNENSWKTMQDEISHLHLSQPYTETKKQQHKNYCLEPLKLKEVPKHKKEYHEEEEEKQQHQLPPLRTPSPIDKRPIRPSPGGRYQIPDDLPGEDLYHAVPIKDTKEVAPKHEKNNNNDSPKKRSPSDLGLFTSVEIRSPFRRRSDMLPPRPPTRNSSMTKLASQLSPKASTPPADLRRITKPSSPVESDSASNGSESNIQESPRTFFTRNKQYRSFNVKTTNVGVNPAVEHLKMLKQKLLDHQQIIKNRGVFQPREV